MKKDGVQTLQLSPALLKHSRLRTDQVVKKVRAALTAMERDIDENDGVYPFNSGRLSQAEVCRRAGISNVTLCTASHRETTHKTVVEWLARLRVSSTVGCRSVRRSVVERVDEWKRAHACVAQSYHLAELEHLEMQRKFEELEKTVAELRSVNESLAKALSDAHAPKIFALHRRNDAGNQC